MREWKVERSNEHGERKAKVGPREGAVDGAIEVKAAVMGIPLMRAYDVW